MTFQVVALRRAEADVRHITRWIADRSHAGAIAWLDAYEQMLAHLADHADACSSALDAPGSSYPLQQTLFGTSHGRTYRAVFTIVGDQVRILRIRGPGQPPLLHDELM
jgi:plasmid stabilization system protein ParE